MLLGNHSLQFSNADLIVLSDNYDTCFWSLTPMSYESTSACISHIPAKTQNSNHKLIIEFISLYPLVLLRVVLSRTMVSFSY